MLLLPLVGFLPATDSRMRVTIEAVELQLGDGPLVRRWPADRSGFLISTCWLVECLALSGEQDRTVQWSALPLTTPTISDCCPRKPTRRR